MDDLLLLFRVRAKKCAGEVTTAMPPFLHPMGTCWSSMMYSAVFTPTPHGRLRQVLYKPQETNIKSQRHVDWLLWANATLVFVWSNKERPNSHRSSMVRTDKAEPEQDEERHAACLSTLLAPLSCARRERG